MEQIIKLRKKDFIIRWYSGSGAGGQHRNKHQNCCQITHIGSGMKENGTENKSRIANQRIAFEKLAKRVIKFMLSELETEKEINNTVIRNYNQPRNEVHDKKSGLKQPYNHVINGDIGDMIESRHLSVNAENAIKEDK